MAMNRQELREALDRAEIRERAYTLDGEHVEGRLCLGRAVTGWTVSFCERGEQAILASFATESEACEYMLTALLRDPTSRIDYVPRVVPPW